MNIFSAFARQFKIPFSYIVRNLWTRKLTTLLTAGGLALVVFVFATVLMLNEGLRQTLVDTGAEDNAVVIRRGADNEVQSGVDRKQASIVESQPQVAFGKNGLRLASKETVVLISLNKRGSEKPSNVVIRGVSETGLVMRPQVKLSAGRMFQPGSSEIVAGSGIARQFNNTGLGEKLRFGQRDWTVVGIFDAGGTGFDSEIWGDAEQLMQAFRRPVFSSVIVKINDMSQFAAFKKEIESDPRLTIETKQERQFYADQSKGLSLFISILGLTLSVIFSIGAMIGAMITMYSSVANRVGEIGTLRALGFRRSSILVAFLTEALLLALVGGVVGLGFASLMQFVSFSTTNFQSFAELAFSFKLNPVIVMASIVFALIMGFLGGFLPAVRASRMKIVDSLRAA
jgi:putative ABC transport system permease protein